MPAPPPSSIFGSLEALPRGPHRLSREQVTASQRTRLMAAVAAVVGERGYATATITEIARRAGVSPNVFYEHFEDKEDCLLAAYQVFAETLLERLSTAVPASADWHEFITTTLDAYLGSLEADRTVARAFLLEMDAAGPTARMRRREASAAFARLLKRRHELIRRRDPALAPLPDRIYAGLALGVRELVCQALEGPGDSPLIELAPDVWRWLTATVEGAAAAQEAVASASARLPTRLRPPARASGRRRAAG